MALMLVLAVTALLLILGMAIVTLSISENKGSKIMVDLMQVRQIHDTAVNLSLSQLRVGMEQEPDVKGREIWVSQPGALRTYKEDGALLRGIKLYSDDAMVVTSESDLVDDVPPLDWNSEANEIHFADLNRPVVRGERAFFPIVDPNAFEAGIEGFDFDENTVLGTVKTGAKKDTRLPMPVRWLYVLQDGTLGALQQNGKFSGPKTPSKSNPIVGRVAFWVDDEATKININTVGEPTPWDTPRAISPDDLSYGISQPARNEFQRYPGHPSTTALSTVLITDRDIEQQDKELIYERIPRVVGGGTFGGTQKPGAILKPDEDRLYATVDEFLYRPDREVNGGEYADLADEAEKIRQLRFFLTSNSRSPELNPRGHPKIAIWPLGWENKYPRTAYDHLVGFCSTIGGQFYGFQRYDAKSSVNDWSLIARNREIYQFLNNELLENVPGYGGDFGTKWDDDLGQVTTQIFDYIRCVNLREKAKSIGEASSGRPRFFAASGQVTPLKIPDGNDGTQGFGRFFTMTEFGLHFICNGHGEEGFQPKDPEPKLGTEERLVQVAFLMEPFSASHGWPALTNDFKVRVTGLNGFKIGEKPLEFPSVAEHRPNHLGRSWHGRSWGGPMGIRTFIGNRGEGYPFLSKRVKVRGDTMSFKGGEVTVEIFSGNSTDPKNLIQTIKLNFPEGEFPVPELVKTGTGSFRGGGATNAQYWRHFGGRYRQTTLVPHAPGAEYSDSKRRWPKDNRGNQPGFKIGGVFRAEDVVRTLTPYHSDNRLVAAQAEIDETMFLPGPNYQTTVRLDHHFNDTQGTHLLYGFGNEPGETSDENNSTEQLTPAKYHYSRLPDVRPGTGNFNLFGDFDNGVAQIHDGAYINRPDEGNVATRGQYAYFAWNYKNPTEVNFSPNRMMPSPGMFGSLPTGLKRDLPWQTLLFRPQAGHPGGESPPDHTVMEYFWMPVIEPYAISEPFSTAGKINLNYQILPFTYIKRATGLHAVMKSERPLAVDNEYSQSYKLWDHETSDHPWLPNDSRGNLDNRTRKQWDDLAKGRVKLRKRIDAVATLEQFEARFENAGIFKYPSEICDIHLVREGEKLTEYVSGDFQASHVVTGDNTRERPYTNLYPRLTTRSNTYRIYVWAESLNKARTSDPEAFDPVFDTVSAQFRGSTLIERYIDPNDPDIPDYAKLEDDSEETLDDFFQFRILESSRFAP